MANDVHLMIERGQLEGVFDGDLSGLEQAEVLIADVGAANAGKPPKKVRATVVPLENYNAGTTVSHDNASTNQVSLSPSRSGKYLGILITLSNGEFMNLNKADISGDDLLTRGVKCSVTGAGATVQPGILLEGGPQPESYFLFLDRDNHKHRNLSNSDVINLDMTNKVPSGGSPALVYYRFMNVIPPRCTLIN